MARRAEPLDAVLGCGIYTADTIPDEVLYVKAVRSSYPHALVRRLDVSKALKVKGVIDVITHADVPGVNVSATLIPDRPLLVRDKVRSLADALALVVGDDPVAVDEAIELVEVEYEPLKPVMTIEEAISDASPKVHEEVERNIVRHYKVRKGNVAKGFEECDVIVEDTYRTQTQDPAALETEAAYAIPDEDGGLTIVGTVQNPFYVRRGVARILNIPEDKLNIIAAPIGGTFGGKSDEAPWDVCAMTGLAALRTNKPAVYIYSRDESMLVHSHRHASLIKHKLGGTYEGKLLAAEVEVYFDTGAYASVGPFVLMRGIVHAAGPYEIPNIKIDGYLVYTNNVMAGSLRGFGNPQVHFAAESQIDQFARKIGMSPVEVRLKNMLRDGSVTATGQVLKDKVSLRECLTNVVHLLNSSNRGGEDINGRSIGYGVALVYHGNSLGPEGEDKASAVISITPDGVVRVRIGLTDYGTGASLGLAKIVSGILNIPPSKVVIERLETRRAPDSGGTFASRSTLMGGNAVKKAAEQLFRKIRNMAFEKGYSITSGEELLRFVSEELREEVSEYAEFQLPTCDFDPEKGSGTPYLQYTYGAVGVEVEVDKELGTVKVRRVIASFDVGRVINRAFAEAQVEGAITQGIGFTLLEELIRGKTGKILNLNLADYLVPTSADLPKVEIILVENPSPITPLGVRTIGEPPICGPAPAIANAVEDATGVRVKELPITAERLLKAVNRI
ncbi:MAG TPA: xanthine dehydrogenase family protein molybdopterin-binding subunit [Candidatus Caldiarchaeum subterraneum]|uniref:Xanthine dehydrogenase family protein molybdopterin-binding subunit n=1 Tax=Caldiarchaeum subterraneum TaxID=311458 RepID=A0A833ED31_CALS0|nr:xanthine dehydrogenase family protein molybdopterin-binding subunit [Candidatus Caldarchaeum subterraneum]